MAITERLPELHATPSTAEMGVSFFVASLCHWWKVALPTGILLAGLVAGVTMWKFQPEYESSAIIEIEDVIPYIAFSQSNSSRGGGQYVQTQIELLRGPIVLEPVLSRSEVSQLKELRDIGDPLKYLTDRLRISQIGRSELYQIAFRGFDRVGSRDIVKAIVAEYFAAQQQDEYVRSERVIELLEDERNKRKFQVDRLRRNVVTLVKEVTGKDPYAQRNDSEVESSLSPLASIGRKIVETDVLREELKAQLKAYEESTVYADVAKGQQQLIEMEVNAHPNVMSLQLEIEQLRTHLDTRRTEHMALLRDKRSWRPDKEFSRLELELQQRESALESLSRQLRRQIARSRGELRDLERSQAIADLQRQLSVAEEKYRVLKERHDAEIKELKSSGAKGVELEFARAELLREERVFDMIAARKLALQTELRAPARVNLRREASVPTTPVEHFPLKPLVLGCLSAFLLPFGIAIGWERFVRRIGDMGQLKSESQLPVLAEVARYPSVAISSVSPRLSKRVRRDIAIVEECIDGLRTTLALTESLRKAGVLTITSAAAGEGKTTISTHLAMSIARYEDTPTLLIDGDTRSPDVHRAFGLPLSPGLSDVLSEECDLFDAVTQIQDTNLFVITAGTSPDNPHEYFHSDTFASCLDTLRARFQHIVVDSPPVLSAFESMLLARHADSVLLCCMRDVSRVRQVHAAVEKLTRSRADLCGVVLSGTPVKSYVYNYGGYQTA